MKKFLGFMLLSLSLFCHSVHAVETLPKHLIYLHSPAGFALVKKNLNPNLMKLLEHFTTQKTGTHCGIASAVMLLNASELQAPIDADHEPYQYFTQDNFFNEEVKKIIPLEEVSKTGLSLTQLSAAINVHGLKATPYRGNEISLTDFRVLLQTALAQEHYVIVNFLRERLRQKGEGHHSPVAAYDVQSDRFLVLDVARYKYSAFWVKTEELWKSVNTLDTEGNYRGFIIIERNA